MEAFDSIKRVSAHDAIVEHFRRLIGEGKLKPGDKLPSERDLAARLGVGRPALREALRELVSLGLLERTPKGTYVNESFENGITDRITSLIVLKKGDAAQLYQARKVIEVGALPFVIGNLNGEILAKLRGYVQKMRLSLGNKPDYITADVSFHSTLLQTANNELLLAITQTLFRLLQQQHKREVRELYARFPEKAPLLLARYDQKAIEEHENIVSALEKRDLAAASSLLAMHIENAEKMLDFKEASAPEEE